MAAALMAAALLLSTGTARAHDAVDPVCGMVIPIESAAATAEHGGRTYYFCFAACRDTFLEAPEKYIAVLAVTRLSGPDTIRLTVTPPEPQAGDLVRCAIAGEDLTGVEAWLYFVDRTVPPVGDVVAPHRMADGSQAFQRTLGVAGEWRVRVRASDRVATYAFSVASRAGKGTAPPVEDARPAAEPNQAPAALPMAEQHEAMRRIGSRWAALGRSFERGTHDVGTRELMEALRRDAALIPRFRLHHHEEAAAEFASLARDFEGGLVALARVAEAEGPGQASAAHRALDLHSCTRCHLKFRWTLVEELGSFPVVRAAAAGDGPEPESPPR